VEETGTFALAVLGLVGGALFLLAIFFPAAVERLGAKRRWFGLGFVWLTTTLGVFALLHFRLGTLAGISIPLSVASLLWVFKKYRLGPIEEDAVVSVHPLSETERAKLDKLIYDGHVLSIEMVIIPEVWCDNAEAWRIEIDGFLEDIKAELALHKHRTLIGVASKDRLVLNRHWLHHSLEILTELRDFRNPWPVHSAYLSDADRAEDKQHHYEGHQWAVERLSALREGRSAVSVYYVSAEDLSLCEAILATFERAGWKIAKDPKPRPYTPAWDARKGIVVHGTKAPEIVDVLSRVFGDVKMGRMTEAEKEGYGHKVRIYVVRRPSLPSTS